VTVNGAAAPGGIDDPVTGHHDPDRAFTACRRWHPLALCHCEQAPGLAERGADLRRRPHHGQITCAASPTGSSSAWASTTARASGMARPPLRHPGVGFSVRWPYDGTQAEVALFTLRAPESQAA
jgi:hypothetical protein